MNRKSRWMDWVLSESARPDTPLPWAGRRGRGAR